MNELSLSILDSKELYTCSTRIHTLVLATEMMAFARARITREENEEKDEA